MAGDNTKDVELRIRARDYSQKTLQQVTQALDDLVKAQDAQINAAKRGDASAKNLEASYKRIEDAAKALLNQASLIKVYEQQAAALAEVQTRTEAARDAQSKLAQQLAAAGNITKAQAAEQAKLARETERAERAQQRAADRLSVTASRLQEFGISATGIAEAQQRIVQSVGAANRALERQDQALQTLDADLKAHRAGVEDLAKALNQVDAATKRQADDELKRAEMSMKWEAALQRIQKAHYEAAKATEAQEKAEAALQDRLRQAAADADGKAKGYATLAQPQRVSAATSASASIGAILDPTGQALKSTDGIEAAIARLEARAKAAVGPVKGFNAAMADVSGAQKAIASLAGLIDAYERQMGAVREARAEYVQARAAVAELATQMRSGLGGEELVRQMTQAQTRLQAAAEAMGRQATRARELQGSLRSAGVATNDIAGAQAQLQQAAQRSVDATNKLKDAVKQYGTAADTVSKSAKGWSFFHSEGERTTLSYMQRLRGEALAMGTAFIGLQAAVQLAKGAIDVTLANAKIQNKLSVLFEGDAKRSAEEFAYLRQVSDTIGVSFENAAQGYTKFAIGAKAAGWSIQEIRFTFENLSIAAKNAGLSTEEYGGVLKAVEQMISKGVIQAEELKGQLGDRLPGAVTFLAQSMGKTTAELLKMMETGGVTARYVLNLATTLGDKFSAVQDTAATRLQAALNRQENATRDFKVALGESGFIEAYTDFLQKLTALMNSPDGKKLANTIGQVFTGIVDAARWGAEHVDLLKTALAALAGVKILTVLYEWQGAFKLLTVAMEGTAVAATTGLFATLAKAAAGGGVLAVASTGVSALAAAFRLLGKSIPFLGVALTVWEIGSALYDKMGNKAQKVAASTEDEAKRLKEYNDNIAKIPTSAPGVDAAGRVINSGLTPNPGTQVNNDDAILSSIQKTFERDDKGNAVGKEAKKIDKKDQQSRMSEAKRQLAERQAIATEELQLQKQQAESIADAMKREKALAIVNAEIKKVMLAEERKFNAEQAKSSESAAAKRIRIATEVAQGLQQLADKTAAREAKIDPNATFEQRMLARRKLAEDTYTEVSNRLEELDKLAKKDPAASKQINAELQKRGFKDLADARAKLNEGKAAAGTESDKETTLKEVERLQKQLTDAQTALDRRKEAIAARVDNGMLTRQEGAEGIAQAATELSPAIQRAGDELQKFITTYQSRLTPDKFNEITAQVDLLQAKLNPAKTGFDERLKVLQAQLQEATDRRAAGLIEIEDLQKRQLITADDVAERTNAAYTNSQAGLNTYLSGLQELIKARLAQRGVSEEERVRLELLNEQYRRQQVDLNNVAKQYGVLQQAQIDAFSTGVTGGISDVTNGLSDMLTGQKSVGEGFRSMGQSLVQTFANVAKSIANTIVQMEIAKRLASSDNETLRAVGVKLGGARQASPTPAVATAATDAAGGAAKDAVAGETAAAALTTAASTAGTAIGTAGEAFAGFVTTAATSFATTVQAAAAGKAIGGAAGAAVGANHTGGLAGASGVRRTVDPSWFNGAPMFHNGGIPGLSRNEVPAILLKNEEVLTRDDPRHILNGGKGATVAQQSSPGNRFVLVDDRAKVHEAMATAEGESVTMVHLKRNLPTLKSWLR